MAFVFDPPPQPAVPVSDGGFFPVRRIFCVGKNYSDHVAEMGGDAAEDPPVFFTKPADAVATGDALTVPFPPGTDNLHFEGELVLALGWDGGAGADNAPLQSRADAEALIFGHAVGCDLTRRDLQTAAKKSGGPWDAAKAFDFSAPMAAIAPVSDTPISALAEARLTLSVNGGVRQDEAVSRMIWSPADILIALSKLFELKPGDLVFTGTPAGVGPLAPGDRVEIAIGDLPALSFSIAPHRAV